MASVILNQVTKRFGPVSVIEGLDLEIRDREELAHEPPGGAVILPRGRLVEEQRRWLEGQRDGQGEALLLPE